MEASDATLVRPGLRERKKQQTRATIGSKEPQAESGRQISQEQAAAILDEALKFLSGGLEALRRGRQTG